MLHKYIGSDHRQGTNRNEQRDQELSVLSTVCPRGTIVLDARGEACPYARCQHGRGDSVQMLKNLRLQITMRRPEVASQWDAALVALYLWPCFYKRTREQLAFNRLAWSPKLASQATPGCPRWTLALS